MALGGLFGKKKPVPPPGPAPGTPGIPVAPGKAPETPAQMVARMQGQGMQQTQIVEALGREGYSQTQIYDALDQASQMQKGGPATPPPMAGPTAGQQPGPPPGPPGPMPGPATPGPYVAPIAPTPQKQEQIDELIEKTVEEKWREFSGEIKKLEEFKKTVENRLAKVETQIENLDQKCDNLKNAIIAKIKDYDLSILNVGTEMKAMEQVFQKILPELQQNVSELSRITSKISVKKNTK